MCYGYCSLTNTLDQRVYSTQLVAKQAGSVAVLFHLLNVPAPPGAEVVYADRSFEAYPIATQLSGATGVPVPLSAAGETIGPVPAL